MCSSQVLTFLRKDNRPSVWFQDVYSRAIDNLQSIQTYGEGWGKQARERGYEWSGRSDVFLSRSLEFPFAPDRVNMLFRRKAYSFEPKETFHFEELRRRLESSRTKTSSLWFNVNSFSSLSHLSTILRDKEKKIFLFLLLLSFFFFAVFFSETKPRGLRYYLWISRKYIFYFLRNSRRDTVYTLSGIHPTHTALFRRVDVGGL